MGFSKKCYQPGFLPSLIDRNVSETRQEIQVRLYQSSREREQRAGSLACLLKGGASWFLICSEDRGQAGRVAWWFAHHFGSAMCKGHAQYPASAPSSRKWQLVFSLFVSCPEFVSTVYTPSCL